MLDRLDKTKTYLVGSVETHDGARRIQQVRETLVPVQDRWCHVAALYFDGNDWQVIEAKFPEGCRKIAAKELLTNIESVEASLVVAVPMPLDIKAMHQHIGKEFATRYALQWIKGQKVPDDPRIPNMVFCTEIIRLHDFGALASHSADDCVPADYQEWAMCRGIPFYVLYRKEETL